MTKKMKTIKVKLTLRAKRATVEFKEGLGVGVLAAEELHFKVPVDYSDVRLAVSIDDYRKALIDDTISVDVEVLE